MSVKRYKALCFYPNCTRPTDEHFQEQSDGMWVKWDDYARLDDENVRLRKMLYDFVDAHEDGQLDALLFVIRQSANKEGQP